MLKADAQVNSLHAELSISLSPEGLWIQGEEGLNISTRTRNKLAAIANVLIERDQNANAAGLIKRSVPISERE